ncbi:MAG: formylglycine-generating enzyme family protein, partial [Polyangiaceae bacterium]|nr:formylglycine-generating enzyme family protein [Polyangiaceae bacterium]
NRIIRASAAAAWLAAAFGCQNSPSSKVAPVKAPGADDIPAAVSIAAQDATLGFASRTPRARVQVESYRIATQPTTVAQYRACVEAGGCQLPTAVESCSAHNDTSPISGPTHTIEQGGQMPMTCTTAEQATQYCRWVGGTLPTMAQWLVAARGSEPQVYAWGEEAPGCDKHPWAYGMLVNPTSCCMGEPGCSVTQLASVGAHPNGASKSGLQDVLLAPAELVLSVGESPCAADGAYCAIIGRRGAIESVEPLSPLDSGPNASHVARRLPMRMGGWPMRTYRALSVLCLVGAACASGCVAGDGQTPDLVSQASEGLSSSPTPVNGWGGTVSDLAAADSWAQCSFRPNSNEPVAVTLVGDGDRYLNKLGEVMESAMIAWRAKKGFPVGALPPTATADQRGMQDTRSAWLAFRNDANWNQDDEGNAVSSGLQKFPLSGADLAPTDTGAAAQQARHAVGAASMNLCMAMALRQTTLRGDVLLMPEAEQQKQAETVRERAQMSALQYAGMLRLAALATNVPTGTPTTYQIAPYIKAAAADPVMQRNWVKDLATAVQLHISATSELAEMFGRSASARTPRGGNALTAADEEWGQGSWRMRGLGLLYGGNPLAGDIRGAVPWRSLLVSSTDIESQKPGVVISSALGPAADWPSSVEMPYVTTEINDSRVSLFQDLARGTPLIPKDGAVWFDNLNTDFTRRGAGKLGGLPDTYAVLQEHGIAARNVLEESTALTQPSGIGPFYVFGGVNAAAGGATELSEPLAMISRPLVEYAASFAGMTPYPWPRVFDGRVERIHPEAAGNTTVRVGDDLGVPAGGIYTDSMRLLGAVPSLVLIRDALIDAANANLVKDAEAKGVAAATRAAIDAAVGTRSVKVRAKDDIVDFNWSACGLPNRTTQQRLQSAKVVAGAYYLGWKVDANVAMPTSVDRNRQPTLYAVPDEPRLYPLTLRPDVVQYGKTITSVLASNEGTSGVASLSGEMVSADVFLPQSRLVSQNKPTRWGFVLKVPLVGGSFRYIMLAQGVQLRAMDMKAATCASWKIPTLMFVPLEGQFFATGGWFGEVAERLVARRPDNPARPLYDGFGLRTSWVPSADATAYGGSPGEIPVTYFLRNAKQSAFEATDAVKLAFEGLMQIKRDDAELLAAESRSSFVAAAEQQRLCGKASPCETSTIEIPGYASRANSLTEPQCRAAEAATLPLDRPANETVDARNARIARAQGIVFQRLTCITQEALAP